MSRTNAAAAGVALAAALAVFGFAAAGRALAAADHGPPAPAAADHGPAAPAKPAEKADAHGHGAAAAKDAHGHGAGGHEPSSPLAGDLGNSLWTLVIFGGLFLVLSKYAWGPLLEGLKSREDYIKGLIESAELQNVKAKESLAEYERKLASARAEVAALIEEGRRDAEKLRADIVAAANKEADEIRARTRREIQSARDAALQEIYEAAGVLATDIAGRIVQRELRPEDQRQLISAALDAYRKN
jgi:F-type H+-transporting ATPase subunit b